MADPKLPVIDFTTYEELQRTNCCTYTTMPSKLIRPLLEDGFEEKAIQCTCSCCNETFALSDLEKVSSNDDSEWPNGQVPVCPTSNCKRRPIEYKNAVFHFLMELHLSRTEEVVEAILEGTAAELYLGCKVHDFLESKEKQNYVKFLLENLFQQHEGTHYTFLLFRKDIFDPDSGPIYIKKIS
uniref:Uncharacterized protein n=2 Tax=Clastoptera arizonana TaxID=38151 RepID=A0A1B6DM55_9HEMI